MKKLIFVCLAGLCAGCGLNNDQATASEVATSVVSGAINNGNAQVGMLEAPRKSPVQKIMEALEPVGTAWAASWSCNGGTLSPTFKGSAGNPYSWTPVSCTVTWGNGKTASSTWSGPFTVNYGTSCDTTHGWIENQAGGCTLTITTGSGGVTRTITGPNGGTYAIIHDSNGQGTGWDSSVSPAPSNGGVVLSCASGGCTQSKNLVINGSHLHGTLTPAGGQAEKVWDHTVSTDASGVTVTGTGTSRVVNGSVTVQHNLAKETAKVTFNAVGYGEAGCCFPTTGSVSTSIVSGKNAGKSESIAFSTTCGEETLTKPDGTTQQITLQHCL